MSSRELKSNLFMYYFILQHTSYYADLCAKAAGPAPEPLEPHQHNAAPSSVSAAEQGGRLAGTQHRTTAATCHPDMSYQAKAVIVPKTRPGHRLEH